MYGKRFLVRELSQRAFRGSRLCIGKNKGKTDVST